MGSIVLSIADYGEEKSTTTFNIANQTSATLDGTITAAVGLQNSINALIIGAARTRTLNAVVNKFTGAVTDPFAQRELKWLISYRDVVTGTIYTMEIPTPDLSLLVAGSDLLDTANIAWTNFVAAVAAVPVLSAAGNAIAFDVGAPRVVGRNL